METKVRVTGLRKRYGTNEALRGVDFSLQAGEIFGLLGPNGAGKTTTLECLLGLREPDAGTVEICGLDARRFPSDVKRKIGVALQSTALQDKITPREALDLFSAFYLEREPTLRLLERFDLVAKADAAFETLSGGQRQRLALALAFVHRPEVVILDEPSTGLDPQARHELHAEIRRMKRDGYTVLLSTHQLDEAEALCDRVAIIDQGRIVATGTPHELVSTAASGHVVRFSASRPIDPAALKRIPGLQRLRCDGLSVYFETEEAATVVTSLMGLLAADGAVLRELDVKRCSLEDVFLKLTRPENNSVSLPA
ncbi:MAG: ABC transporter ATP-binding protein [Opitutaceae bacterium]